MFSKLTICLVMTISFTMAGQAFAQATKQETKKESKAKKSSTKQQEAPKVEEATPATTPAPVTAPAPAAATAATPEAPVEKDPVIRYVKEKFTFSYHGEFYYKRIDPLSTNKEDRKLQDTFIMHNPTITYSPIKDLKFLATSEFKYTDAVAGGTYIDRHYRSLVTLTKANILTEAENGIKLDFGIGRRIFDRNEGRSSVYGNNRAFANMSKKAGKASLGLFAQYLNNDPAKGRIANSTWKHSIELVPSVSFQITDKLSYFFNDDFIINTPWRDVATQNDYSMTHEMNVGVLSYQVNDTNSSYFQLKYLHIEDFSQYKDQEDWLEYYIGHTINVTPKASVTFEIGSELVKNSDGRDGFSKKVEYPELAMYVDFSL